MISTFTAFFDSNVFFGARLRSLNMSLALTGLFRARWSEQVHDEWMAAVVKKRPDLTREDLEPTRQAMNAAVLDCVVESYESLVPALTLPDENDRHILAAAIKCRASVIVTFNEADFPAEALESFGIHSRHPDQFILDVLTLGPSAAHAIKNDRLHYKNPPLTVDQYLADLTSANVPKTADFLGRIRVLLE